MMDSSDYSSSPPVPRPFSSELTLTLTLTPTPQPTPSPPPAHNQDPHNDQILHVQALKPEDRGIKLIQLLLTCAAHVSSDNLHRADLCLRLISALSSPSGDSMQRLAARFASSLAARLLRRRWPGLFSALQTPAPDPSAQFAFSRALPYLPFAHAVVSRTLFGALAHERVVHVVGLGCVGPDLWTPLLRAFSRMPDGPPHLILTCVDPDANSLDSLGSTLLKEAESLEVPFRFHPVAVPLAELNPDMVRVRSGEALAVVSILSLHVLLAEANETVGPTKLNCRRIEGFLSMVNSMSPKLVMVVEQESNHNSDRMVDRFVEGLHYYSALFDSVDSAVGAGAMTREERRAVEEMVGREIENVVACEGWERVERHERIGQWGERLVRAGFGQVSLLPDAMEEAKRVVGMYPGGGDGYRVVAERGCLMICWHDRPMYAVSGWHC